MPDGAARLQGVLERLRGLGSTVVAFSGGVDSTFLLHVALEALGRERVLAVTVESPVYPPEEMAEAQRLAERLGARHRRLELDQLSDPEFCANPPTRCYVCKRRFFGELLRIASAEGLAAVVDGSNADDRLDYRPGRRALQELGIASPLAEAGLTKAQIRELSRARGLPTWDRPAMACLASRVPYGEPITLEKLARIGRAEAALRARGLPLVRVRDHGTVARIEVPRAELEKLLDPHLRANVVLDLKTAGYVFVALDLEGYRTGALNEALMANRGPGPGTP